MSLFNKNGNRCFTIAVLYIEMFYFNYLSRYVRFSFGSYWLFLYNFYFLFGSYTC